MNIFTLSQRGLCILFSVVFTPSSHGSAWALPVISLFLTNTVSPGVGLPTHMIGDV